MCSSDLPEGASAPIGAGIALVGAHDEPLPENIAGNGAGKPASAPAAGTPGGQNDSKTRVAPAPDQNQARVRVENSMAPQPAAAATINMQAPPMGDQGRIFISPVARRLAEEHHIDYSYIRGTGPNGRIIKMDIEAAVAQAAQRPAAAVTAPMPEVPVQPEPVPVAVDTGDIVEIPLTSMRRTIAKRLSQSMQTAPHFYVTSVIDTGKLADLRQQINEYAANDPAPIKASFNDLIIKAVARALVRMPQVNVSFAEDRLIQKKSVHIGMAVALEQGLIVPVLHNVDRQGILDIARESHRLAEAARTGKLRPEDLSGGTFTVSNLGMFDVDSFTAVINPPESAILAVGSITPTPVVVDGQVVVRNRMKVTLSSDHRAIDGATAARFLQEVKRLLEEPFGLLL